MKLFLIVVAIYLGIDAVVVFIKALVEAMAASDSFPLAEGLDIIISLGLMVWAIFLLVR